jgi:hypothetical protein
MQRDSNVTAIIVACGSSSGAGKRSGQAKPWHGTAWHGMAWHGTARHGTAEHSRACDVMLLFDAPSLRFLQ